jgi:hypothetical protein
MLRYWQPIIVTPIFQTAGYARALLLAAQTDTSDEVINPLVEAKLERATILYRAEPPDVVALIDELVLHRLVGSAEIMHEQLLRIAEVLHTDAVPEGHTTESRSLVRKAGVTFERTHGYAMSRVQSRGLILEVANERWKQ